MPQNLICPPHGAKPASSLQGNPRLSTGPSASPSRRSILSTTKPSLTSLRTFRSVSSHFSPPPLDKSIFGTGSRPPFDLHRPLGSPLSKEGIDREWQRPK